MVDLNKKTTYELLLEIHKLEKMKESYQDWNYSNEIIKHFIWTEIDERNSILEDRFAELSYEEIEWLELDEKTLTERFGKNKHDK